MDELGHMLGRIVAPSLLNAREHDAKPESWPDSAVVAVLFPKPIDRADLIPAAGRECEQVLSGG
jgi:hypothetical protein